MLHDSKRSKDPFAEQIPQGFLPDTKTKRAVSEAGMHMNGFMVNTKTRRFYDA